jgi:glycosyltransferase involved in cell wall biosynthesis
MPLVDPAIVATRLPRMMTRTIASGMRRAACVTCVSDATRREVAALELADPDRLVVIPNGVQPTITAAPSPDVDGALEHLLGARDAGTIELLHVGSCIPRKRIDLLLDVMAAISAEVPRVRLLKAGGQLTPGQKAQACRLGIADAIVQVPFLSPEMLAALYRRADAVLVTSSREGFGLPVIEALAAGTPVVASDLPVLREVGGSVATYAPLDDICAWRDAVLRAIAHRIARTGALIGTGAAVSTHSCESDGEQRRERTRHAARFSWADAAAQLSRVYERLAANA